MMSDTPRCDELSEGPYQAHEAMELAESLERELSAANARADQARGDALEEAANVCQQRADMHRQWLPPGHYFLYGDHAQAATCGRRDEAELLEHDIRALINAAQGEMSK